MTRARHLLCIAAGALAFAACGGEDGPVGTSAPERSPTVELRPRPLVIEGRRIEISAVAPARGRGDALRFPITSGDAGDAQLGGRLRFRSRGQELTWDGLRFDGDRLIADLDGGRGPVLRLLSPPPSVMRGTSVVLTEEGATALDRAFDTSQFIEGQLIGRLRVSAPPAR